MIVKSNKTYGVETKIIESGAPVLQDITITSNGEYTADTSQGYDGLGTVTANVQPNLTALNATANGTYTPTSPVQGYNSVTVNVSNTPQYLTATYMSKSSLYTIQILNTTDNIAGWRFKGYSSWNTTVTGNITVDTYGLIEIEFDLTDYSVGLMPAQFQGCTDLVKIELPANITSIGGWCFANTGLTDYPDMTYITTTGEDLFYNCYIKSLGLTINDGAIRNYDNFTFNGFDNTDVIDKVYVNGTLYIAMFSQHTEYDGDVDFTNGIDGLPIRKWFMYAGHMHYTLNSLKLPSTLEYMSGFIFKDCTITDLYFYGTTPPTCIPFEGNNMWVGANITNIYVPAAALSAYQNSADFADVVSKIQAMP